MKIKHKLLASFLVATLVPVLVVALFTIRNVTEEAKVQFQVHQVQIIEIRVQIQILVRSRSRPRAQENLNLV